MEEVVLGLKLTTKIQESVSAARGEDTTTSAVVSDVRKYRAARVVSAGLPDWGSMAADDLNTGKQ